jgi:hypothetical protein
VPDITLSCDDCDFTTTAPERGPGSAAFKLGTHRWRVHGIRSSKEPRVRAPRAPRETSPVEVEVQSDGAGEAYAEQTPREPKHAKKESPGLLGKFWNTDSKDKEPGSVAEKLGLPKTTERKPTVAKRRVSTADFWGDLVAPAAGLSARAGYVPMARAMEWSSPVVGEIIEDATKGTLADKAVQPFVRNAERWQDLFDLLGFWGAIGMAQRNPANAAGSLEFARKRLVNLLPRIAANIKKERAKERQAVEALVELMPDISELFPDMGPNDDPVALLIQSLFAAPEGQHVAEPVAV